MDPNPYESADAKHTHRIEMLMLAILVPLSTFSMFLLGPVSSNLITTSSSLSSHTSTSSVARTTYPLLLYSSIHSDLLHCGPPAYHGPHFLPFRDIELDDLIGE